MKRFLKRKLSRMLSMQPVQKFLIERYWLAALLHRSSEMYLRRFSNLDARYFRWLFALEQSKELEGDIVELGVGPGRFLVYCGTWRRITGSNKRYWGYDTFAGFPSVHEKDLVGLAPERVDRVKPGVYAFYNKRRIEKLAGRLGLTAITLVEGDFAETLARIRPEKVSFLYMDCDLYESYKAGLELLYDRVVPGGIILFDEYEYVREWPGARRAVDEFFADKVEKPEKLPFSSSYYVVRGRGTVSGSPGVVSTATPR